MTGPDEGAPSPPNEVGPQEPTARPGTPRDEGLLTGWDQFHADVLGSRRSVQPLAGWLLSGLLGLVGWLTVVYGEVFDPDKKGHGADPSGVITVEAGYATLLIVAVLTVVVAFEPYGSRLSERWGKPLFRWLGSSHAAVRLPVTAVGAVIGFIWQLPSFILSFIDFILARPVAWIVGATQEGWGIRYAWGAIVIFAAIGAGLYAPAPWGLYAVIAGIVAIVAIVRRWNWSEADRETFLVERGIRNGAMRVGFKEDLRDEALLAITFLFVLIPLGLRQIQILTCADGTCAFTLEGGNTLPPDALGQFTVWLGYFGAELAKSVPFVDWSEVFHVANGSPIEPETPLGAQIVFAMRATLDLLLLAAVLQAVQIASRLRDQWTAFNASRLPILEPHTEKRLFKSTCEAIEPCLEQHPTQQHAIASFPAYEDSRLHEVIQNRNEGSDPLVRQAAVALLASQHASEATDKFFTEQEQKEADPEVRDWIVHVAAGVTRERDANDHEADRARLKALLEDTSEAASRRAAAARRLARTPHAEATTVLLQERLAAPKESIEVRAASALALARHRPKEALGDIAKLAEVLSDQGGRDRELRQTAKSHARRGLSADDASTLAAAAFNTSAMATSHALARCAPGSDAKAIASAFADPLRELAAFAARIQAEPMAIDAAKAREPGAALNQMVRIAPGEGPFKPSFTLGSGDNDGLAFPEEKPAQSINLTRAFAIGRYSVTQQEYSFFEKIGGVRSNQARRRQNSGWGSSRWPAMEVSWRDGNAYCRWLEMVTGHIYRLPTEIEWEFSCRAGSESRYWWGNDFDSSRSNSNESKPSTPRDVGSLHPNDWGLWDMSGNGFEWCCDPWHDSHLGRPLDERIWSHDGDFSRRVTRGGSWGGSPTGHRSAYRAHEVTDGRYEYICFRLARTLNF